MIPVAATQLSLLLSISHVYIWKTICSIHLQMSWHEQVNKIQSKRFYRGKSLAVQWLGPVGLWALRAGVMGSIPGCGTKSPQAKYHDQKNKGENRFHGKQFLSELSDLFLGRAEPDFFLCRKREASSMGLICFALSWFDMLHCLEKHSPVWSDIEAVALGLPT